MERPALVVDASVAIKWLPPEDGREHALRIQDLYQEEKVDLHRAIALGCRSRECLVETGAAISLRKPLCAAMEISFWMLRSYWIRYLWRLPPSDSRLHTATRFTTVYTLH